MQPKQQRIGRLAVLCSAIVVIAIAVARRIATTEPAARGKQVVAQQNKAVAARSTATVIRDKAPGRQAANIMVAARAQLGTAYDPTYVKLAYPGGDVPADRGVCTDVVLRALRR